MRITVTETTEGVVLTFSNSPYDGRTDSVAIRHSEVKNLSVEEGMALLHNKLIDKLNITVEEPDRGQPEPEVRGIVEVEIAEVEREPLEVELDGDEDDEDLSLFEVEVDIDW